MSITRINTNSDALLAASHLRKLDFGLSQTISHLSTGLRITTGADDPSGVALANKFAGQLGGTRQAITNAQDALNLMAHADTALNETQDILRRMRDLAVKAANSAVLTTADMSRIGSEFRSLRTEIDRRAGSVTFNSRVLLSGAYANQTVQAGADNGTGYRLTLNISAVTVTTLSLTGAGVSTVAAARSAITVVQNALNKISTMQATIGVQERKLQWVIDDLASAEVNMAAAKSRITDADMAGEISEFTRLQVLSQAATSMLAQANASPSRVMSLLGLNA